MRALYATICLMFAFSLVCPDVEAQRKRRKRRAKKTKKVAQASEQTKIGINKLMGKFKWGTKPGKILRDLEIDLTKDFKTRIQKERDPLKQDRMRRNMLLAIKKLKKNYIGFKGKHTPWDLSLVDKEFAHKNNEAMIVLWGKRDRKFFFFHHGRLWKIYIAFNTEMFKGKSFADFSGVMEGRFGKAERKYTTSLTGETKLGHLEWPPAGATRLKAIDNTALYGNFCLVLLDIAAQENVLEGRKLNSPNKKGGDPLVEAVTKEGTETVDDNEDIVDRITGKGSKTPASGGSTYKPRKPGTVVTTPPKRRKPRKVDTNDPLKGLDI